MVLTHFIPQNFRINTSSSKDLEQKLESLSPEEEVEIFLHPLIGRGFMGEADYSDAVINILEKVRSYGLKTTDGKTRETSIGLLSELTEEASSSSWDIQLYLAALSIKVMKRRDDLTFREGPVKIFLFKDYNHPLGTYIKHNTSKRMVAQIEYVPFGSKEIKTIDATDIGYIRIRKENAN
ncbi:MAG: hypothetical protein V2A62_04315 [Candidatus Woesearchaeota archaeon]